MKKTISLFLILTILCSFPAFASVQKEYNIDEIISDTADYICKTVTEPTVGSVGGEWTVLALARSGCEIPENYFGRYYENVEKYVKEKNGILHDRKYTEYSRIILSLTSIGKNPADVSGYNLLTPLGDYEKTTYQGINGAIWALIALDCQSYPMPHNSDAAVQASREMYINHILDSQLSDGGWALVGDVADPDVTAMALQALSKYQHNDKVRYATEKALECLSRTQNENGGFSLYENDNSESSVQVIVALSELGISIDDERFVKNGKSILDNLLTFYIHGQGFKHTHSGIADQMATEQCLYALVALKRADENANSLYNMSDAVPFSNSSNTVGLAGKNPHVQKMNITNPGKTFADIKDHKQKDSIEQLASRGIINGKTQNTFAPDSTMSRAEFATIVTRGLGLVPKNTSAFDDVTAGDWFYSYVNTAHSYGIINGVSQKRFDPNGTITREEAAVMVERAAKLCGINTQMQADEVRDVLAQFFDYVTASDWSKASLAFCCREDIISCDVTDIKPKENITRAEIAAMLWRMLSLAKLI